LGCTEKEIKKRKVVEMYFVQYQTIDGEGNVISTYEMPEYLLENGTIVKSYYGWDGSCLLFREVK